jgi:hypothetical protein
MIVIQFDAFPLNFKQTFFFSVNLQNPRLIFISRFLSFVLTILNAFNEMIAFHNEKLRGSRLSVIFEAFKRPRVPLIMKN